MTSSTCVVHHMSQPLCVCIRLCEVTLLVFRAVICAPFSLVNCCSHVSHQCGGPHSILKSVALTKSFGRSLFVFTKTTGTTQIFFDVPSTLFVDPSVTCSAVSSSSLFDETPPEPLSLSKKVDDNEEVCLPLPFCLYCFDFC